MSSVPLMSLWCKPLPPILIFFWSLRNMLIHRFPLFESAAMGDDTWAGFLTERDAVLDVLEFVPNVIVLSGVRFDFFPFC